MRSQSADDVKRIIMARYNADQVGWQVLLGRDARGYFTTLFTHHSKSEKRQWLLKEEFITPFKSVGLGTELRATQPPQDLPLDFGFRTLNEDLTSSIMSKLSQGSDITHLLVDILSKIKPSPLDKPEGPLVVQGPMIATPNPLDFISEGQRKLEAQLGNQLEIIVNRQFPEQAVRYR